MERDWTKTGLPSLSPPPVVKQPGRPRKLRIKEVGEIPNKARRFARLKKQYVYRICHQDGHNARSCAKRAELQAKLKKKASDLGAKQKDIQPEETCHPEEQHEPEGGVNTN